MQKLSKRKGVISVFLLIIFMVTYVFMGLLVDAARYHMAGAYMESAIDQAGNSVLSNYNRLLFDLYGLFAVETDAKDKAAMETKIQELYNHYLEDTLGIADVDVEEYQTVLNTIFAGIKGEEKPNTTTKQLYDFQVTNLSSGTVVTLADSANVESQIIEHMKFRAPVDLVDGMSGFLNKIKGLLEVADRVQDAIEKTEITAKYETGGEDSLSSKAYNLQADINKFAVKLYNYTCNPTKRLDDSGAADPGEMLDRNQVYENNPYFLKELIKTFDEKVYAASIEYTNALEDIENNYSNELLLLLIKFKSELKKADEEIVVKGNYEKEGGGSDTKKFSEISFHAEKLTVPLTIELAEDLYKALDEKKTKEEAKPEEKEEQPDYEKDYMKDYEKKRNDYENGRLKEKIKEEYKEKHQNAKNDMVTDFENIEANASFLYEEINHLRGRLDDVIGQYDSYIAEMEAKLAEGGSNKETVYGPEIELAKANAGELLKNLDLLFNSRQYLNRIASGYDRELLSDWIGRQAGVVIGKRETFFIHHDPASAEEATEIDKIYFTKTPLEKSVDEDTFVSKNGQECESLYKNPYIEAVGELLPLEQADLYVLYSHASYFQTCHYRKDVDVKTGKSVSENQIDTNKAKEEAEKVKEQPQGGKALDNEEMLKDADYPKYLTVNYEHSEYAEETSEANSEVSVDGKKADANMLLGILNVAKDLINQLSNLLEGARDNLYVNTYILSVLPNYYDYQFMNAGKNENDFPVAFQKEYEAYTASYASVEYIITGAGAGKNQAFSDKIKAGEDGKPGTGFGKLSVEKMRTKLFGTRMLFNCVSMFTDSAKYTQASSLSAWAGPFAPLVTIVLMVAWAAAESVLDVMVLMQEGVGSQLNAEGQVALLKQGKDWFFSIEGAVSTVANAVIDGITQEAKDKTADLASSLEAKTNAVIYDVYHNVQTGVGQTMDSVKNSCMETVNSWTAELNKNIETSNLMKGMEEFEGVDLQDGLNAAQDTVHKLSSDVTNQMNQAFEQAQGGIDQITGIAVEHAVTAVSRASKMVVDKANSAIDSASDSAKKFLKNNITKVIPVGEVVNSGEASKITMGYKDYLQFYLFFMNGEMKIKRIQSVLQANMWVGGHKDFKMETSPASVWADLECTVKYFFMSNTLVPESMRKNGRLRLKTISGQSY